MALVAAGTLSVAAAACVAAAPRPRPPREGPGASAHQAALVAVAGWPAAAPAQSRSRHQPRRRVTAAARAVSAPSGSPRQVAVAMLGSFGWRPGQFACLDPLWAHESGWSVTAYNAGSGAYGIAQALPGSKMASAGPHWQSSAATQIRWGLTYIKNGYGSPCTAWAHEQATGWY